MRINSSADIKCSTSLTNPHALSFEGHFHGDMVVMYLSIDKGVVSTATSAKNFKGRISAVSDPEANHGCGLTLQLSMLAMMDTDMYYCIWTYYNIKTSSLETKKSNGTIIIVRDRDPAEDCHGYMDLTLIVLSVAAIVVIFFIFMAALIWRCTRTKQHYKPAKARNNQPHSVHTCPMHSSQLFVYSSMFSDSRHRDIL